MYEFETVFSDFSDRLDETKLSTAMALAILIVDHDYLSLKEGYESHELDIQSKFFRFCEFMNLARHCSPLNPLPADIDKDEENDDTSNSSKRKMEKGPNYADLKRMLFQPEQLDELITLIQTHAEQRKDNSEGPITVYIASSIQSLKCRYVYQSIRVIADHLSTHLTQPVALTILEDLIHVGRVYVLTQTERSMFRNITRLTDIIPALHSITLKSSNELTNRWGSGDTLLIKLPGVEGCIEEIWQRVMEEVPFQEMLVQGNPVPRLVSILSLAQSFLENGNNSTEVCNSNTNCLFRPLYRHPNDPEAEPSPVEISACPVSLELMNLLQIHGAECGVSGLNHALVQLYRDGRDCISAHSDKTLDIDRACPIVNLSLGATRYMTLQNKQRPEIRERIPLRSGEALIFGIRTNAEWTHEVPRAVPVLPHDCHPSAIIGSQRISFTFRRIATFTAVDGSIAVPIGQGSPFKRPEDANLEEIAAISSDASNARNCRDALIKAFGQENRNSSDFDWEAVYGSGFIYR